MSKELMWFKGWLLNQKITIYTNSVRGRSMICTVSNIEAIIHLQDKEGNILFRGTIFRITRAGINTLVISY